MIQRIQTIYLLLVVILSSLLFFVPVAGWIIDGVSQQQLTFMGVVADGVGVGNLPTWSLSTLSVIIPLVTFVSIFLYKRRILQIRMNVFNILLMIGYYILLTLLIWLGNAPENVTDWFIEIIACVPLVNVILSALAIRAILKDEALVRSLNRIR